MALCHQMFSRERERDNHSYIVVSEEISESESPFFLCDRAFFSLTLTLGTSLNRTVNLFSFLPFSTAFYTTFLREKAFSL